MVFEVECVLESHVEFLKLLLFWQFGQDVFRDEDMVPNLFIIED